MRGVFGTPKSGKPREVPLSNQARQALSAYRHTRSERVFCDAEGRPFKTGIMLSKLWRMCRLVKLGRKIGWHVARHTFASHLVMRGVAIRAVQEMMGHASMSSRSATPTSRTRFHATRCSSSMQPQIISRPSVATCADRSRANRVPKRADGSRSRVIFLAPPRGARPRGSIESLLPSTLCNPAVEVIRSTRNGWAEPDACSQGTWERHA